MQTLIATNFTKLVWLCMETFLPIQKKIPDPFLQSKPKKQKHIPNELLASPEHRPDSHGRVGD